MKKLIGLVMLVSFVSGCGHVIISKKDLAWREDVSKVLGKMQASINCEKSDRQYEADETTERGRRQMDAELDADLCAVGYTWHCEESRLAREKERDKREFKSGRKGLNERLDRAVEEVVIEAEARLCAKGYEWFCKGQTKQGD